MNLHLYRYGEAKLPPGLSVGIARQLPRGIPRTHYVSGGYFDVWLPVLAPSPALASAYRSKEIPFAVFARKYRTEMKPPAPHHVIQLLAALALRERINLGCHCLDENCCHRSVLRELILKAVPELPPRPGPHARFSSPACSMPEIED